jgi:hypothetical protein
MLETPGCWAWEEIGALLAGVFCGVLFFQSVFSQAVKEEESYGATGKSAFLFLMGSDMVVGGWCKRGKRGVEGKEFGVLGEEDGLEDGGILSAGGQRGLAGRDLWLSRLQN